MGRFPNFFFGKYLMARDPRPGPLCQRRRHTEPTLSEGLPLVLADILSREFLVVSHRRRAIFIESAGETDSLLATSRPLSADVGETVYRRSCLA